MNHIVKNLLDHCLANKVQLQIQWVPSAEQLADRLSRWNQDRGDKTLADDIFVKILHFFRDQISPDTDMFASPGNSKFKKFVSRGPHSRLF